MNLSRQNVTQMKTSTRQPKSLFSRSPKSWPPQDRVDGFLEQNLKLERLEDLRRLFLLKAYNSDVSRGR